MASTGPLAGDCSGIDEALGARGDLAFAIHGQLAPVIEILLPPGHSLLADFRSLLSFGETIRTEMWRDGPVLSFRARVVERDVVAINNGRAEIAL